ncbi:hypothetical protein [Chryseobacterium indologenes]|uniref:hypothetical protein n=1 Tax=Chryseobacterium indologenes TaxID=253 RepID=UPI001023F4EC|nr:hypothetical protein [Chryseobacterium indologenes]VFA41321.1 Uncharacterised protein [Chryseobacterium indologenes]
MLIDLFYFVILMKNYIKYILPFKKKFCKIELNSRELIFLENLVVKFLNVRDLNQLRDKFEGQAFLDNYIQKALPLMALQKYLKEDLIDFESISPAKIKSNIIIDNILVNIIQFGNHLPLVDTSQNMPCIFIHTTQKQVLEICGFISAEDVKNNISDIKRYGFGSKETVKGSFYGFDKLKMFDSIEQLRNLVKH